MRKWRETWYGKASGGDRENGDGLKSFPGRVDFTNMLKLLVGDPASRVEINSLKLIVAALIIHTIGPQTVLLLPGFVQGLVEYVGFSEADAGFIASAEMIGMTCGTIAMMFLVGRVNWRHVFAISLLLLIFGNIASIFITEVISQISSAMDADATMYLFCALRFITGIGGGFIVSLSYTVFGLTAKADRNFGLGIFFVLVYSAVVYPFLPWIFGSYGMPGLLLFFAVFAVVGLPFVRMMPVSGEEHREIDENARHIHWSGKGMALAAMLVYFVAAFAVWPYLFRMGINAGVAEQEVANSLSLSQFLGMAGAFTAALLGARYGRGLMLTLGITGTALPLVFLFGATDALTYLVIVSAFQYAWNLSHPYLLAAMASFDPTGKMVVYATAMQFLGVSAGPAAAAMLVGGEGFRAVLILGISLFFLSLALILPPVIARARLGN